MRTILILDDDRVFRRLLLDALQKRGHRVLEAGRAAEADLLLSSEQPDLLLVDGLLPDTAGDEIADRVDSLLGIPGPKSVEQK